MWEEFRYRTKWIRWCFWKGCNMKQHSPIRITGGRFTKEGPYKGVDKVWEAKESALLWSLEQGQAWRERGESSFQSLEERPHWREQWSSAEGHGRAEGPWPFPPLSLWPPARAVYCQTPMQTRGQERSLVSLLGRDQGRQGQSGSGRKKERYVVKMFQLIQFIKRKCSDSNFLH